jgi:hypothetical protein
MVARRHHRTRARTEAQIRFQHEAVEAREAGLPLSASQLAAAKAFDKRALATLQHIMRAQRRRRVPMRMAVRLELRQIRRRQATSISTRRIAGHAGSSNPRASRRRRAKSRSPGRKSSPPDDGGPLLGRLRHHSTEPQPFDCHTETEAAQLRGLERHHDPGELCGAKVRDVPSSRLAAILEEAA